MTLSIYQAMKWTAPWPFNTHFKMIRKNAEERGDQFIKNIFASVEFLRNVTFVSAGLTTGTLYLLNRLITLIEKVHNPKDRELILNVVSKIELCVGLTGVLSTLAGVHMVVRGAKKFYQYQALCAKNQALEAEMQARAAQIAQIRILQVQGQISRLEYRAQQRPFEVGEAQFPPLLQSLGDRENQRASRVFVNKLGLIKESLTTDLPGLYEQSPSGFLAGLSMHSLSRDIEARLATH